MSSPQLASFTTAGLNYVDQQAASFIARVRTAEGRMNEALAEKQPAKTQQPQRKARPTHLRLV